MPPLVKCSLCNKTFNLSNSLRRHCRNVHPELQPQKIPNFNCAICIKKCVKFDDLKSHLLKSHGIVLRSQSFEFKDSSEFDKWKKGIEGSENSLYVKKNAGSILANKDRSVIFHCHRSGCYKPKVSSPERKRELKMQGSSKINAFCPSQIKTLFCNDDTVKADFISTHVGHDSDLAYITLSADDRKDLAVQIASKIPFDDILENVQATVLNEALKRKHLITRHDLSNIEREFKLVGESVRHGNDAINVDAWVEKEMSVSSSCILVYKKMGVDIPEKFPDFKRDDFALGIMTDAQLKILQRFGSDCICIDFTHELNQNGYKIMTLMVLEDAKHGFPCAFFISNRSDAVSIECFLKSVKDTAGQINTKVFMSDPAESFYNIWRSIMSDSEKQLYCTWHVNRDWQKNLMIIKGIETRQETYKRVRAVMQENDETAFLIMLSAVVDELIVKDETEQFGKYFHKYYAENWKAWAYCVRTSADVNANFHLENTHEAIKHLFIKGNTVKQLDKALCSIMRFINGKIIDRLTTLEKGKILSKLRELRVRHNQSVKLDIDLVASTSDRSWEVCSSFKIPKLYTVELIKPVCDCLLVCTPCNACIHKFTCTCVDSSVKRNMCKHIHLVCRSLKLIHEKKISLVEESSNDSNFRVYGNENIMTEELVFLSEVQNEVEESLAIISESKQQLITDFTSIVQGLNSDEEINVVKNYLKNLVPLLNSTRNCSVITLNPVSHEIACKKIDAQRDFKLKREMIAENSPAKPDIETALVYPTIIESQIQHAVEEALIPIEEVEIVIESID